MTTECQILCLVSFVQDDSTPLSVAAGEGHHDTVQVLLSSKATVDQADKVSTVNPLKLTPFLFNVLPNSVILTPFNFNVG